ncbi:hypothetical protein AB0878_10685 [Amycolatopsis sp. NPDC047767]|uniref:hypothetical protein n=1 Tax=Amycolatopsis sp. NPDC047767 TaxID=3156765 RepID=UPI003453C6E6
MTTAPFGEPPAPGKPGSLPEFAVRLRALREWSGVRLRALPALVERERTARGVPPEAVRCAYGTAREIFREEPKRYNEELLFDVIRALLRKAQPPAEALERHVLRWRESYHHARRRRPAKAVFPGFSIGPLSTSVQLLEGNGEREIAESDVHVLVTPRAVSLPPVVANLREKLREEQKYRRKRGLEHHALLSRYAVHDFVVNRRGPEELPEVTIHFVHSDYLTFLASQQLDELLPGGDTLRSLYLDGRDPQDTPDFMRSSFGLNIAVVTADGWLVVARRSGRVGVGKGEWNSSANEGLQRELDGKHGPPNLFRAAERGLKEELRLRPDHYDLKLLAFAVVTVNSQWCCLFLANLRTMTRRQFENNLGRGVQDAWEHRGFDYVEFEPQATIEYLLRPDRRDSWAPAAPVLFYLSLVHVHGEEATDRVVETLEAQQNTGEGPQRPSPAQPGQPAIT